MSPPLTIVTPPTAGESERQVWRAVAGHLGLTPCFAAGTSGEWVVAVGAHELRLAREPAESTAASRPMTIAIGGEERRLWSMATGDQSDDFVRPLAHLFNCGEERENPRRDRFGTVQPDFSPRHRLNQLSEPFFENFCSFIEDRLGLVSRPRFPNSCKWALAVSCDVDLLDDDHLERVERWFATRAVDRPTILVAAVGAAERTSRDPDYDLNTPLTRQRIAELADWAEIGLHSSYLAHDRGDLLIEQRQRLEDVVGRPVTGHRGHFLRFAYPRSWAHQRRAGFAYDASAAYNDLPGLRLGTASPIPFLDPEDGICNFTVVPTAILDQHFQVPKKIDDDMVNVTLDLWCRQMRRGSGMLTVDWHTYTLDRGWWNHLDWLIGAARRQGAYVAGIGRSLAYWQGAGESVANDFLL